MFCEQLQLCSMTMSLEYNQMFVLAEKKEEKKEEKKKHDSIHNAIFERLGAETQCSLVFHLHFPSCFVLVLKTKWVNFVKLFDKANKLNTLHTKSVSLSSSLLLWQILWYLDSSKPQSASHYFSSDWMHLLIFFFSTCVAAPRFVFIWN